METKLFDSLRDAGYLCTRNFSASVEAALATRPCAGAFLFGPAGSGKSFLPETLACVLGAEMHFFQCFPGTREDDLLVKMLPSEQTVSGIALHDGVISAAAKASRVTGDGKIILVLDEWDKTRPSSDSFLLDFLQSGRINFNGHSTVADLSRLIVFIAMNDEREISEPLLRRLPLIRFEHLPASLVREALNLTHLAHPQLEAAIMLYERCLMAGLAKPATIQELRQLLDAITLLGDSADWDSLVFQFVTKTRENHALLKCAEKYETRTQQEERERLAIEAYETRQPAAEEPQQTETPPAPRLPRLSEMRQHIPVISPADAPAPDLTGAAGVVVHTDATYDAVVGLTDTPPADPTELGPARVEAGHLIFREPIPLAEYEKIAPLWGETGEIVFVERTATLEEILALRANGLKIVKFSASEILGKTEGIDLRWTAGAGAEIICDLRTGKNVLSSIKLCGFPKFNCEDVGCKQTWYAACSGKACGKKQIVRQEKIKSTWLRVGEWKRGPAIVIIAKEGQEKRHLGNNVRVSATLYLPDDLARDLSAGLRIFEVGGNCGNWGSSSSQKEGMRYCRKEFSAPTYREAVIAANRYTEEEITKLLLALRTRREALRKAEASLPAKEEK